MERKRKISKAKGVEICIEHLLKGEKNSEIVQKVSTSCIVSGRTVNNWIAAAMPAVRQRQEAAQKIREAETTQSIQEAAKNGLRTDLEIEIFLCQLAMGDIQIEEMIKGKPILRGLAPTERLNAIDKIFKKRGSYQKEMDMPPLVTVQGETVNINWNETKTYPKGE